MDEAKKIFEVLEGLHPFPEVENGQLTWAKHDQQHVGFIYIKPIDSYEAEIIYIGVLPTYHKKGFGQFLLHTAQKDYQKLYLEVETSNIPAYKLYKKMGFTTQRTRFHYYGEQRHAFDMIWTHKQ